MTLRTSLKNLLGLAWHVKGDAVVDAMTPAADGTAEAGKPLVLDSDLAINGVTIAELVRAADVSARIVSLTTASPALTVADHEGKTLVLNKADGIAVTLPAATGSGAIFRFVVGTTFSGGSFVATCTGNDTLKGVALGDDGDGEPANGWSAGASDEVFTMNGGTQGGFVGDEVVFQDIAADVWQVKAFLTQTGSEATPFSSAA
jgi:hypothetical protein